MTTMGAITLVGLIIFVGKVLLEVAEQVRFEREQAARKAAYRAERSKPVADVMPIYEALQKHGIFCEYDATITWADFDDMVGNI